MPSCAYVAYTWTSNRPNDSLLEFIIDDLQSAANGYRSILNIKLNIDENIVALNPYADAHNKYSSDDIYIKTHRSFTVPLSLLYKIENSANTDIHMVTDAGIIKADFNNR